MDKDKAELVRQLYTQVGMALEDASAVAIKLGGSYNELDAGGIVEVEAAVLTATQLLRAARPLSE